VIDDVQIASQHLFYTKEMAAFFLFLSRKETAAVLFVRVARALECLGSPAPRRAR
jgi:hypothetical protein